MASFKKTVGVMLLAYWLFAIRFCLLAIGSE